MLRIGRIIAIAAALLVPLAGASAAELTIYSTIGVKVPLEDLAPKFEKETGHKLTITWGTGATLVKRVQQGETADVLILGRPGLEELVKDGKASAAPDASFASAGIGVVVKQGAPKPDISTPEALKQTLLAAKSVAYSDPAFGGASGVYFEKLLQRMGIADEMNPKTRHPPAGGSSAVLVASGEVELAVQQAPEIISVPGIDWVGTLPPSLDNVTVNAAGIGAGSKETGAARAFIAFLHSPEAVAVFKAKGLNPV